jgi:DNA-binding transcriptional regulator GbsR (MarR family)
VKDLKEMKITPYFRSNLLNLMEIQADKPKLPEYYQSISEEFILLWGEMASSWGINRTMAQIHALLYVSPEPLDTDVIMEQLQISRGNANMNLRNLLNWKLVYRVHQMGSRKDYYTAEKDVWKMSAQIIKERNKLEIKPVRQQLNQLVAQLDENQSVDFAAENQMLKDRMENFIRLLTLFESFVDIFEPMVQSKKIDTLEQVLEMMKRFK